MKTTLCLLFIFPALVFGTVHTPAIISDNMVLAESDKACIWGWADPEEKISVSFQGRTETTAADKSGSWSVFLKTKQTSQPETLIIKAQNTLTINNVFVGQVWVCSGQSNMQMPLKGKVWNSAKVISQANYPMIRMFNVGLVSKQQPQPDCNGKWSVCTPQNCSSFSAVAYFFGQNLYKELKVPVGLINSSLGGTPVEAWMSRESLEATSESEPIWARWNQWQAQRPKSQKLYDSQVAQWTVNVKLAKDSNKPLPPRPSIPQSLRDSWLPSGLFNAMINPITKFEIRGVIWYQGESNVERAYQYRKLFNAMIKDWRTHWNSELPFYYVQIAPYKGYKPFMGPELQESQLLTLSVPNTGMAVTSDIGDVNDIHPGNKREVGRRLALMALAKTYGKDIKYSGPVYKNFEIAKDKIKCFFEYSDGIEIRGNANNFEIADANKVFVKAMAKVENSTIVVYSPEIKNPEAVRYCWRNDAVGSVFNNAGLPASPFATDNWERVTQDAR